jgi:hypothetical protein
MYFLSFTSPTILDLADVSRLSEDVYLTDGTSPFRVVRPFTPPDGEVLLEDCMSLELSSCAAVDLWNRGVRRVRPEEEIHPIRDLDDAVSSELPPRLRSPVD